MSNNDSSLLPRIIIVLLCVGWMNDGGNALFLGILITMQVISLVIHAYIRSTE